MIYRVFSKLQKWRASQSSRFNSRLVFASIKVELQRGFIARHTMDNLFFQRVRSPANNHLGLISPNMKNQLSGSLEVAPRSRWDVSPFYFFVRKNYLRRFLCRLSKEFSAIVRVESVSSCHEERGRDLMRFWRKTLSSPFPIVRIFTINFTTNKEPKWNSHDPHRHRVS